MKTPVCPRCKESETIIRHNRTDWECPNCNTVWVQAMGKHPQDPSDARHDMVIKEEIRKLYDKCLAAEETDDIVAAFQTLLGEDKEQSK